MPLWRRAEMIFGNILGSTVILASAIGLIFREYVEVDRTVQACIDAGTTCWPEPSAFARFAIYAKLVGTHIPVDQGIAGFAHTFGVAVIVEDARRDARHYKAVDRSTGYRTEAVLAVPIKAPGGASMGCMELLNPLNIVQWASLASSALGNSSFGQVRNQANNMRSIQFTLRVSY